LRQEAGGTLSDVDRLRDAARSTGFQQTDNLGRTQVELAAYLPTSGENPTDVLAQADTTIELTIERNRTVGAPLFLRGLAEFARATPADLRGDDPEAGPTRSPRPWPLRR
jgi:hypothetical protein